MHPHRLLFVSFQMASLVASTLKLMPHNFSEPVFELRPSSLRTLTTLRHFAEKDRRELGFENGTNLQFGRLGAKTSDAQFNSELNLE